MARIGLFPLPLVLVPTERVPLHVFEPRYKELVGECLELEQEFGIVLARAPGDVARVGTRASVDEVLQVLPDGRMHIVVEGGDRFRLLEIEHDRSFDVGVIEELVDEDDPPHAEALEGVRRAFGRLLEAVGGSGDPPDAASPTFDFEVAARVGFDVESKQELLELASPRRRTERLTEMLERAIEAVAIERALRERVGGNGRLGPLERRSE